MCGYEKDADTFCRNLPADAVYAKGTGEITSLAFVEDNEIAYVCGRDKRHFADFACGLVTDLFKKFETVCFESDNCDRAAMLLRSMFKNQGETSYDTYIYDS